MDFSGQYLTYDEYRDLGGTLAETSFNLLEFEARRQIDIRTFNRLKNIEDIPQEVKLCEFNLINSIDAYVSAMNETASNGNIKSENTDGYSVSYSSPSEISDIVKSKNAEFEDTIKTYLLGIIINGEHIMYCGVR